MSEKTMCILNVQVVRRLKISASQANIVEYCNTIKIKV
jgi:hypothetical protein